MELAVRRLLCVIAHPDDETIGCGATLARAADEGAEVRVLLSVRRTDPRGLATWDDLLDQFHRAVAILGGEAVVSNDLVTEERAEADVKALHDIVLPHAEWADTVITHWPGDAHQVHRQMARAVEIATRPFRRRRTVAFMEVATSTDQSFGPAFSPNMYVGVSDEQAERKIRAVAQYRGEMDAGRSPADLHARLQDRGRTIGADLAESFVLARSFF